MGRFAACISIHLYKITTSQQGAFYVSGFHFCDGNTVGINGYLVTQLIATLIFTIHNYIHRLTPYRVRSLQSTAQLESQDVTHQRLVTIIVDKRPFLCLGGTFQFAILHYTVALAVIELDSVRFFGETCRSITTHSSQDRIFLDECSFIINDTYVGFKILALTLGILSVIGMNTYRGKVGNLIELRIISNTFISIEFQL